MQVGALNFGLWLDLRRMLVVHDRFQGGDSEGDSGDIWARFGGDAERDSEGGAGEIRHGSLSIKVLHAYVN